MKVDINCLSRVTQPKNHVGNRPQTVSNNNTHSGATMTFRTSINSNGKPKDFLKRGLKSMFPNYEDEQKNTPPVDTGNSSRSKESS